MKSKKRFCAASTLIPLLITMSAVCASAQANRINVAIEPNRRVSLRGAISPLAQTQYDQGSVAPSFDLPYLVMILAPDEAQRVALKQLLRDQADSSSDRYRHWLTPEEYADRFGLSVSDFEKIRIWLEAGGFEIKHTARARDWIAFGGTAAQIQAAFQAQVHRYLINGETHFSIAAEPSVPSALAPAVAGLTGLHDFYPTPPKHRSALPGEGSGPNSLVPSDLATIYNIGQLYHEGIRTPNTR